MPVPQLKVIEEDVDERTHVLALRGELDVATVPTLPAVRPTGYGSGWLGPDCSLRPVLAGIARPEKKRRTHGPRRGPGPLSLTLSPKGGDDVCGLFGTGHRACPAAAADFEADYFGTENEQPRFAPVMIHQCCAR